MNYKKDLLLVCMVILTVTVFAQQPLAPCWHPSGVLNWTPESDPDAKFNKSTVPLQPRFTDNGVQPNPYQHPEGQISALITMNPSCSQTPSQGANNFIGYNPTFWQYMDILIWWGGSASEGIITPPSAPAIDIAHANGVKILGTVYFSDGAWGGRQEWINEMLTFQNGEYVGARKLYEIAKYYGFDGWCINEETAHGGLYATWAKFFDTFNRYKSLDGNDQMEIQWYDGNVKIGNRLDMLKRDGVSYLLNYGSPSLSNINEQMRLLTNNGFSSQEAFKKAYFGAEQHIARDEFLNLFNQNKHNGSLMLFNPEEGTWKDEIRDYLETDKACGKPAYDAMKNVFRNEGHYWTNVLNDVTNTDRWDASQTTAPGYSNAIMERSVIQSTPFVTTFSAGLGKKRYVEGEVRGVQDWYHRGMQDLLPTWRWWFQTTSLSVDYYFDDGYNSGTSLFVDGPLKTGEDNILRLYKTKLEIKSGDKFQLVYKTARKGTIQLQLGIAANKNELRSFTLTEYPATNGWTIGEVDLSEITGQTVSVVALNFKSSTSIPSYQVYLGQLGFINSSYIPDAPMVTNLKSENMLEESGGNIRLTWDNPESSDIHHYNIYVDKDGAKTLAGQTRNEGFYIPGIKREGPSQTSVNVYVATVGNNMKEINEAVTTLNFPEIGEIKVLLKASKTLIKPGETITVEARATSFPTSYRWRIPEGAELVSSSGDKATYRFPREGKYDIRVTVQNATSSVDKTEEGLIEVSQTQTADIVSVGKDIVESSGYTSTEEPKWIIDGTEIPNSEHEKWCAAGKKEHWVVIDLKQLYRIYRFKLIDAGNKETPKDNVNNYKIWLSNDLEGWELVVDEKNRVENTKDDWIKPVTARYVKFLAYDDNITRTIRIWEFEVFGRSGNHTISGTEDVTMNLLSTQNKKLSFSFGGDVKDPAYTIAATSSNPDLVSVTNESLDEQAGIYSFDLTSSSLTGTATITVNFSNGGWIKTTTFNVVVEDQAISNLALHKVPAVVTGSEPADEETNPSAMTDGNNDTYWLSSYEEFENKVTIDLGEDFDLSEVKVLFKANTASLCYLPAGFTLSATDKNGNNYTNLVTVSKEDIQRENANVVSAQGVRFIELTADPQNDLGFAICEIEVYGKSVTGINKYERDIQFSVFPNPVAANENLTVRSESAHQVRIISMQGSLLLEEAITNGVAAISMNSLNTGSYLLMLIGDNGVITTKLIIK